MPESQDDGDVVVDERRQAELELVELLEATSQYDVYAGLILTADKFLHADLGERFEAAIAPPHKDFIEKVRAVMTP